MADDPKHKPSGGASITRRLPIRDSLVTAVLGADYSTPRKVTKIRKKGSSPPKGPDELILEIRRLHEQSGMQPVQIAKHLEAFGFDVPANRVRNICEYTTRAHLVPLQGASPYITKAAP